MSIAVLVFCIWDGTSVIKIGKMGMSCNFLHFIFSYHGNSIKVELWLSINVAFRVSIKSLGPSKSYLGQGTAEACMALHCSPHCDVASI